MMQRKTGSLRLIFHLVTPTFAALVTLANDAPVETGVEKMLAIRVFERRPPDMCQNGPGQADWIIKLLKEKLALERFYKQLTSSCTSQPFVVLYNYKICIFELSKKLLYPMEPLPNILAKKQAGCDTVDEETLEKVAKALGIEKKPLKI